MAALHAVSLFDSVHTFLALVFCFSRPHFLGEVRAREGRPPQIPVPARGAVKGRATSPLEVGDLWNYSLGALESYHAEVGLRRS
eukprot:5240869-Pleurochrysis_carterae.AAC.1